MERVQQVACIGKKKNRYGFLIGKSLRKRAQWEDVSIDNMKMDLNEMEWEVVDWVNLPQDRDSRGFMWTK
jgi:hypothetical protein